MYTYNECPNTGFMTDLKTETDLSMSTNNSLLSVITPAHLQSLKLVELHLNSNIPLMLSEYFWYSNTLLSPRLDTIIRGVLFRNISSFWIVLDLSWMEVERPSPFVCDSHQTHRTIVTCSPVKCSKNSTMIFENETSADVQRNMNFLPC